MAENHDIGKKGEELALTHLTANGYKILATNWVWNHREIDILAQKDDTLLVAEVKTRTSLSFGEPEAFVSKAKQRLLIEAANHYIDKHKLSLEVRFDIISIVFKGNSHQLHHIEDAFYPVV